MAAGNAGLIGSLELIRDEAGHVELRLGHRKAGFIGSLESRSDGVTGVKLSRGHLTSESRIPEKSLTGVVFFSRLSLV